MSQTFELVRIPSHSPPRREDNKSLCDSLWIELEPWSTLSTGQLLHNAGQTDTPYGQSPWLAGDNQ